MKKGLRRANILLNEYEGMMIDGI